MGAHDNDDKLPSPRPASEMLVFQDWEGIVVDGAFHVRDVALAKKLGFARPRVIRELIERNQAEIASFGPSPQRTAMVDIGSGAKREVQETYLNQAQALVIVRHSATPNADAIYAEMIDVFLRFKNGELTPEMAYFSSRPVKPNHIQPTLPAVTRRFDQAVVAVMMDREELIASANARDIDAIAAAKADMDVRALEAKLLKAKANALARRDTADCANIRHNTVAELIPAFNDRYQNQPSLYRDGLARLAPEAAILHAVLERNDDDLDRLALLDVLRERYGLIIDKWSLTTALLKLSDWKLLVSDVDGLKAVHTGHGHHGEALSALIAQAKFDVVDLRPDGDLQIRPRAAAALLETPDVPMSGAVRLVLGLRSLGRESVKRYSEGIVPGALIGQEPIRLPAFDGDQQIGETPTHEAPAIGAPTITAPAITAPAASAPEEQPTFKLSDLIVAGLMKHPDGLTRGKILAAASTEAGRALNADSVSTEIYRAKMRGQIMHKDKRWYAN
jgi:hypothetical protein